MIKIELKKQENDIIGFRMTGHAGYAVSGEDIICSAISMLTINCINSIEELVGDGFVMEEDTKTGTIDFEVKGTPSPESLLLLKSWHLGISAIEKDVEGRYVKIINR